MITALNIVASFIRIAFFGRWDQDGEQPRKQGGVSQDQLGQQDIFMSMIEELGHI